MTGKFTGSGEVQREQVPWGSLAWFSSPAVTGAKALVVVEVTINPSGGHSFHKHPNQEEAIYVIDGEVEQWIGPRKRLLAAGESAFIGKDVVHASFNASDRTAKLLAVLSPSVGPEGYELVDVAEQEPWASIR